MTDTRLAIAIADEAGIHDAPTIVTWTEIFNLIDAARKYEREVCAKICDDSAERNCNTTARLRWPIEALAARIRERSNVELTGAGTASG